MNGRSLAPVFFAPLLTVALNAALVANAQVTVPRDNYPNRAVRIIVPFAPGGSDIAARMLAQKLTDKLGQSFIIDNRPGAASVLGTDVAAKSAPDGYAVLFCTASHSVTAAYYRKLPYDPIRDFAAVGSVGSVPFVLATHPALPVRTVKEFVALAKARPNELFYASPGTGGIGHLANELFARRTGIRVTHVGYKGTGPMLTAMLSGEVQFALPNLSGALELLRAGRLRSLGVAAAQRSPLAPDLVTLREAGVDLVSGTWYGMMVPRGTPQHVVDLLSREVTALLRTSDLREQLMGRGIVVEISTPPEFTEFVRAEIAKWTGVMRESGIPQE